LGVIHNKSEKKLIIFLKYHEIIDGSIYFPIFIFYFCLFTLPLHSLEKGQNIIL
jgi:hypothetical protein